MCVLSIELVWVEIDGKMEEKPPFLGIFEGWYRFQTVRYRYDKCSGRLVPVPKNRYQHPMFSFRPVLVFWPSLGHFLSDLSDSSCLLN